MQDLGAAFQVIQSYYCIKNYTLQEWHVILSVAIAFCSEDKDVINFESNRETLKIKFGRLKSILAKTSNCPDWPLFKSTAMHSE